MTVTVTPGPGLQLKADSEPVSAESVSPTQALQSGGRAQARARALMASTKSYARP